MREIPSSPYLGRGCVETVLGTFMASVERTRCSGLNKRYTWSAASCSSNGRNYAGYERPKLFKIKERFLVGCTERCVVSIIKSAILVTEELAELQAIEYERKFNLIVLASHQRISSTNWAR